jgi:DNA-binding transcriptional LysR family regulator
LLRQLRRDHPDLELVVVTGNAPEIIGGVARSELDFGIVTLPVPDGRFHVSPFCDDPLVAIAPPERVWRRQRAMTAEALGRHPLILYERGGFIRRVIDEWFERSGVRPRIAMELGNAEALKQLVSAGLGLAISSAVTVATDVRRGALVALPLVPPLRRRLGIIRRRAMAIRPSVGVVLAVLESFRDRRRRSAKER